MSHLLVVTSDRTECVQLAARVPDLRVSVVAKAKYAELYSGLAEVACVSDVTRLDEVLNAAFRLSRGERFGGAVAAIERGIVSAAFVRSYLDVPGMDLTTSARFFNKFVMKSRLRAAGVPVTDFVSIFGCDELPAAVRAVGLPAVLKPTVGAGTKQTWLLESAADVECFLAGPGPASILGVPMLVERYVPMRAELHCDAVVADGVAVHVSASRYFRPLLADLGGAIGSYTLNDDDPLAHELTALHQRVVGALGMRSGITHLEAFDTGSGLVMSEVTCRPGGGGVAQVIEARHGWDIWAALLATGMGLPVPQPRPAAYPGAVVGWCGLPGRNGLVTHLTGPDELMAAVDGVYRVDMRHRLGQVVSERMTSTFNAGVAFFAVPDYAAAERVHAGLVDHYRVRTRPVTAQEAHGTSA